MAQADPSFLRRLLLELCGSGAISSEALKRLGPAEWQQLDRMAAQHRLQPLLHARHRNNSALPEALREEWRNAHRTAAMAALAWGAELVHLVPLLEAHGYAPIALKGAWLARYAYPEAAQRPCRDLDILLTPETVLGAFECLVANGYKLEDTLEMTLEDSLRLDKHLPALLSPLGVRIELHHRLWEVDGRLAHALPEAHEAEVRARAERNADGITYPRSDDMLAHLIVHAIYSHRLDCGPLLLSDLDYLLKITVIDWPSFWDRAEREGWRDGARLVLELVVRYNPETIVDFGWDRGDPLPAGMIETAPELLLQNLETRRSAGVLAAALKEGGGGLLRHLRGGSRSAGSETASRDLAQEGGYLGWAWSRLRRTSSELASAEVRQQSRGLAQLSRWLDR